jgi:hypothetical protein
MRPARQRIATAACLLLAGAGAAAAPFPYDADVDRFGTAIAAPIGRRDGVRKAMEYCGSTFPELGWDAYSAYGQWVRRHAGFLQLTIAMRRALLAAAEKEPRGGEGPEWRRLAEDDVPRLAEGLSAGLVHGIESLPSADERRQACREAIATVASRKHDLDGVEPAVAKYLREISGKFRIALPAPGEASPAGAARTDAQALVGKWTTEKIRYYLSDGRAGEDDARCTLDFSGKTLVSECQVAGRQIRVVSAYEVREPGRYESRVLENDAYPAMVGARDITVFRVEGGKLVTSSYLPIASADPMRPVEIEAVLSPGVLSGRRSQ